MGQNFLSRKFEEWPLTQKIGLKELPERIKIVTVQTARTQITDSLVKRIDITRFSKFKLLINTTARVLKLYERFKQSKKTVGNGPEVSNADAVKAMDFWIKESQKELHDVRADKLARLVPRYTDGIIVVGGRTERWMQSTWNRQLFVLLPYSSRLSLLIAEYEHVSCGHIGVAATVSRIRSKFWIIKIHKLVSRIVNQCVECRKRPASQSGQIMGVLPIERLPSPFFTTSVDYFGPFIIRGEVQKRVRGKCYGVIFVCFTTRTVYVDISRDYSTASFLQVLRRFACVRGWPNKLYSDNGSQLVGASKELKGAIEGLSRERLKSYCIQKEMEWEFTPANAPWMNGITESLVKSVKRTLNAIVGEHVMEFSVLQTIMLQVTELINSRPIGRHPTNPEDGVYLSPNDLLLGRSSNRAPQGPFSEGTGSKRRYEFIQPLTSGFWKKWVRDFSPVLLVRQKWHVQKRNIRVGDIVIIKDSNILRGRWKQGMVATVYPSEGGTVRKVTVAYKNMKDDGKVSIYKGVAYTMIETPVHNLIVLVAVEDLQKEPNSRVWWPGSVSAINKKMHVN